MDVQIAAMVAGQNTLCDGILRSLPEWFGIESALVRYVSDCERWPTWIAWIDGAPVGFITVHTHFPRAAEIHCIAVAPQRHRAGVGRRLVEFAGEVLRAAGVEYLQVKTLGPSRPSVEYERTRRFYEAMGFVALEEFKDLWPGNPALQMISRLPPLIGTGVPSAAPAARACEA